MRARIRQSRPIALAPILLAVVGCATDGTVTIRNATESEFVGSLDERQLALSNGESISFNLKIGTRFLFFGPDEMEMTLSGEACTRTPFSVNISIKSDEETVHVIRPDAACLSVENHGIYLVDGVYFRPTSTPDWGPNQLPALIPQLGVANWRIAPGLYDFLVVDTNNDSTLFFPKLDSIPIFTPGDTTWVIGLDTLRVGETRTLVHPYEPGGPGGDESGYQGAETDPLGMVTLNEVAIEVRDLITQEPLGGVYVGYFFGDGYDVFIARPEATHLPRIVARNLDRFGAVRGRSDPQRGRPFQEPVVLNLHPIAGDDTDFRIESLSGDSEEAWKRFVRTICLLVRCFPTGTLSQLFYAGTFPALDAFRYDADCHRMAALVLPGEDDVPAYHLIAFSDDAVDAMWQDELSDILGGPDASATTLDLFKVEDATCAPLEVLVLSSKPQLTNPAIEVEGNLVTFRATGADTEEYGWFFELDDPTVSCADALAGLDLTYHALVRRTDGGPDPGRLELGTNHGGRISAVADILKVGAYAGQLWVVDDTAVNADSSDWIPFTLE